MSRAPDSQEGSSDQTDAEWVVRRDRGLTPQEHAAYDRWRERSGSQERNRMESVWRWLDSAGRDPSLTAEADALEARLLRRGPAAVRRRVVVGMLAVAAALALLAWIGGNPSAESVAAGYQVLASTAQVTRLPDGSVAQLNGDSRLEVDFSGTERRVTLLQGEAHFEVTRNPHQPFLVRAGGTTVRAVGTAFNVRLSGETVEVMVTEGTVRIENARTADPAVADSLTPAQVPGGSGPFVHAGERVRIPLQPEPQPAPLQVSTVVAHEVEQALAWQTTRLVFNETPLDQVVAAFNAHNPVKLLLGEDRLRERTLTGVFRADNVDGFVRLARASLDVEVQPAEAGVIRLRAVR